jgi:hypothetical protein
LTKVKRNLTPEDISAISASLKQWREKTQRRPVSAPAK